MAGFRLNGLKSKMIAVVVLLVGLSCQAEMQNAISVEYKNPEQYIDIMESDSTKARSIESFKTTMDKFFKGEAVQYLKPGHRLTLEITDVDRAGDMRYDITPDMREMRILKDVVRVRIDINYTLFDENQKVLKQGSESLKDFYTLNSIAQRSFNNERLYFEKQLLKDWLAKLENK
jgi:hypothetical protein